MVDSLEDPRRTDPPWTGPEREMLEGWLEFHRITLLLKCDGLGEAGRKARPVSTSLLSLHGLVRHMADVERNWFQRRLSGADVPPLYYDFDQHPDGDFELLEDADWDADLATWQAECQTARELAAERGLDDTFVHERLGVEISLRWVYLHMIEEYARHNGHADLIREMVDGSVGD
ncbi:MAG: DinB family protein [Acidimicrobiales bacterium]